MIWCFECLKCLVKWIFDCSEVFMMDVYGCDYIFKVEMGFDKEGNVLALWVKIYVNLGVYLFIFVFCVFIWLYGMLMQGLYVIFKINVDVIGVFINMVMVDVYWGVGWLEVIYLLECFMDMVVLEMDMDLAEFCLKNFIFLFDGVEQLGYQIQVVL